MRPARILAALLPLALALAGCPAATNVGPGPTCGHPGAACQSNADCCSYGCQLSTCSANPVEGGWCRNSQDCALGMSCKADHCTAAAGVCRDDGDVCTTDAQCCSGNCTIDAICVRGNSVPVALITGGAGGAVPHGATTGWSGTTSYDPDQTAIQAWEWTITQRPAGSAAQLSGATTSVATLKPDLDGAWTVQLRVSDGIAWSAPATASITAVNFAPVARLTAPSSVPAKTVVKLSAASSSDANSDPLTYAWTVTVGAAATPVVLDTTDPVNPTFTASVADVYAVRLVVNDGVVDSAPVQTTVTSANYAPVASAGQSRVINLGKGGGPQVQLDGSGSSDPNPGDVLSYAWTFTPPAGSLAALDSAASQKPVFTPDVPGTYTASLIVSDGLVSSAAASTVTVTVLPHVWKLGYAVVDAEYSKPLDAIVAVSASGTGGVLHVIDPVGETERTLALAKPPTCVAVSQDGTKAVVGHDALLTYVDLTGGVPTRVTADLTVPIQVGDCLLGPQLTGVEKPTPLEHRYAYLLQSYGSYPYSIDLPVPPSRAAAGAPTAFPSTASAGMHGVLEPAAGALWIDDYGSSLDEFPLTAGVVGSELYYGYTDVSGTPFISEHPAPNTRIYGSNGHAVTLVINPSTFDPTYAGSLTGSQSTSLLLQHASHRLTATADLLAVIPQDDTWTTPFEDGEVRVYGGLDLVQQADKSHPLPLWGAATTATYRTHGRFVFQRSDASARYVILWPEPTAPDAGQDAIATFAP
jgi:hypothetical protein